METPTLRDRLKDRRHDERRAATVAARLAAARTVPQPIVSLPAEPSADAIARAAGVVRPVPVRPAVHAAPEPIAARWDELVWAIEHDGHGQSEAFDTGFKACLRALGVSEEDIAVLFAEGGPS